MIETKKWYQSLAVHGGLVSFITMLSFFFNLNLGSEETTLIAQGVLGAIGVIMTIYGRLRAKMMIQ